jgi:hypothetical protein
MKKKIFSLFLLLTLPFIASGQVKIGELWYVLSGTEAEVTFARDTYGYRHSDIIIPTSVSYDEVDYSVTSIAKTAFYDCDSLKNIVIPNSVTNIGNYAFYDCDGLLSVEIPNSVTSIGDRTFEGCTFISENFINHSSLSDEVHWGAKVVDTEEIDGLVIEGNTLIHGRPWITNVTIPETVTSIGDEAFRDCILLSSITIPESVVSIGYSAFSHCRSLTNITIPKNIETIEGYAFVDCFFNAENFVNHSALSDENNWGAVVVNGEEKDGVLIHDNTLICCRPTVNSVTIPNNVTSVGESAFGYCSLLTSITIPEGVTSIGAYAFLYCQNLTHIYFPASLDNIGNHAFNFCFNLKYISVDFRNPIFIAYANEALIEKATNILLCGTTSGYIPPTVTAIGNQAFVGRIFDNHHINIPENVSSIGQYAFVASSVRSISINKNLTFCDYAAFNFSDILCPYYTTQISDVYIEDLTAWFNIDFPNPRSTPLMNGANLYLNDQLLNSITIPEEIEVVKQSALWGWSGKEIIIPKTVKAISYGAFSECNELERVVSYIPADAIFEVPDLDNFQKCSLYVPAGAKESYIAKGWDEYFDPIIEMEPEPFTLNVSSAEYATLYLTDAVEVPENVEVYTAEEVSNGYVYLNPVTGVIPSNTGVVVHAEEGSYDFAYYTGEPVSPVLNNLFKGTAVDTYITPSKGKTAYVLSAVDGEVGFYRAELKNGQFLNNANKVYLEVPELALNEGEIDSSQQLSLKFKFPETTAVEGVEVSTTQTDVYYNLKGVRITRPTQKGIYLKNGKKFIVK